MQSLTRKDWSEIEAPCDEYYHIISMFSRFIKFDNDKFMSYKPGFELICLEYQIAYFLLLPSHNIQMLNMLINRMEYYNLINTIAYEEAYRIFNEYLLGLRTPDDKNHNIIFNHLSFMPYSHQLELVNKVSENNDIIFYNALIGKTSAVFGLLFNTDATILYVNDDEASCKYVAKIAYHMGVPFAIANTSKPFIELKKNNICKNYPLRIVITNSEKACELLEIKDNNYGLLYLDDFYMCFNNIKRIHRLFGLLPIKTVIVGEYFKDICKISDKVSVINHDLRDIAIVDHNYVEYSGKRKMKPPDFGEHRILIVTNNPFKKCNAVFKNQCYYKLLDQGISIHSKNSTDQEYNYLARQKLHNCHTIFTDLSDINIKMPYDYIIIDNNIYKHYNKCALRILIKALSTSVQFCIVIDIDISKDVNIINEQLISEFKKHNHILEKTQEHPRHPHFTEMMMHKYEIINLDKI